MAKTRKLKISTIFILLGLSLIAWRISLMCTIALTDNTESRYASIAQLTVNHGFWLMPHIQIDQPFFAKPPLSTWLSALSAQILGISEFSLRLPSLLAGLLTLWAIWRWNIHLSKTARLFSLFAALTSPLFFISIGSVMTDATQMACVTVALLCAYKCLFSVSRSAYSSAPLATTKHDPSIAPSHTLLATASPTPEASWKWGFWIACGLGMLSKGLATIALISLPLALFAICTAPCKRLWQALWSPLGVLLAALICIPWYVFAELAYPGFLKYFFVGEHWMRFTQAGWAGDQYGHAHRYPFGIIWGFWAIAILPWLWIFIKQAFITLRPQRWKKISEEECFLWCACLAPLLFFTFTRNLILTYPLTALPPFAALLGYWYPRLSLQRLILISVLTISIAIISSSLWLPRALETYSTRNLVQVFCTHAKPGQMLIYSNLAPYSAYFYSDHRIRTVTDPKTFQTLLQTPNQFITLDLTQAAMLTTIPSTHYQMLHKNDKNMLIKTLP